MCYTKKGSPLIIFTRQKEYIRKNLKTNLPFEQVGIFKPCLPPLPQQTSQKLIKLIPSSVRFYNQSHQTTQSSKRENENKVEPSSLEP